MDTPKKEGFFAKIWAGIKANTQVEELEANLYPEPRKMMSPKAAEVEYQRYGSGDRVLEVELTSSLAAEAGTTVEIWINETQILDLIHTGQKQKFYLRTKEGQLVPEVVKGQTAALRIGGEIIATGVFKVD